MKKRCLVPLTLLFCLVAAAGLAAAGEALSLARVIETARLYNPASSLAAVRAQLATIRHDQLKEQVDLLMKKYVAGLAMPDAEIRVLYVGPAQAEQIKATAQRREEMDRDLLVFEAQRNYLEVQKALDRLELARLSLERAEEQKRLAEAAYRAGTVARSDVLGAQSLVKMAEAQFFAAQSAVLSARAALNKTMGFAPDREVALEEGFLPPVPGELDLEKGLASALDNRLDVLAARENLKVKEKERAFARHTYAAGTSLRDEAELAYEEAALALQEAEAAARLEVFQLYYRLAGTDKQLAALEQSVEYAAQTHRLAVLRYSVGVGTQADVTAALLALAEREADLLHARYDSYLGYLNWRLVTGQRLE